MRQSPRGFRTTPRERKLAAVKSLVCYLFGVVLFGLGMLVVPEGVRDFRRFALMREADVQVPAEVLHVERKKVPFDSRSSNPASAFETVEDATLRYAVDGTTYTCVARLYLPIGQTKPGDRMGVHFIATDPGRCYLPNAVVGSWVMSLLLPVLLMGLGAALLWLGFFLRAQAAPTPPRRRR